MDWAEKRTWMERAGRQFDPKITAKMISNPICFFGGTPRYARQTALVVESGLSVATGPRCGCYCMRMYLNYSKLMLHSGLLGRNLSLWDSIQQIRTILQAFSESGRSPQLNESTTSCERIPVKNRRGN